MIFQSRKPLAVGTILRLGGPEGYTGVRDEHGDIQRQPVAVVRVAAADVPDRLPRAGRGLTAWREREWRGGGPQWQWRPALDADAAPADLAEYEAALARMAQSAEGGNGMTEALVVADPAPDVRSALVASIRPLANDVDVLTVTQPAEFIWAGELLKRIRRVRTQIAALLDPHIEGAKEAKRVAEANRKRLCDDKDLLDGQLVPLETAILAKMDAFEAAQERLRVAEEARVQALLEAEQQERRLAEALALEEEALTAPTVEDATAIELEMESVLAEPLPAVHVNLGPVVPKVGGLSRPENWHFVLDDVDALLTALLGGKLDPVLTKELKTRISEAVLVPLHQRARALKSALRIPGGRAVSDRGHRLR